MMRRKLILFFAAMFLIIAMAGEVWADISNAAVLYLRIAPGARAAAMGEAYVAVADDATSTHWNPAGLGAYPLADSWVEEKIPHHLQPIKAITALKRRKSSDYLAYEIWAVTSLGLARYDNKDWHIDETFSTRTDQTVRMIVSSYFDVTDDVRLNPMLEKVAVVNNRKSYSFLEGLRDRVITAIPDDYSDREPLGIVLDSLLVGYEQCRINWDKIRDIEKQLETGLKDSVLNEVECDRINIAIEKARTRFIPEDLRIPYSVNLPGELTSIAATDEYLLIGTRGGLVAYDGKRWRTITVADGLPSDTIECLFARGNEAYIGTSQGLARFVDHRLAEVQNTEQIPDGPVMAVSFYDNDNIWIVLGDDLYHYNGSGWSNTMDYQLALDDTPETIAQKFALYGTSTEMKKYLEKYTEANLATGGRGVKPNSAPIVSDVSQELSGNIMDMIAAGTVHPDTTIDTTASTEPVVDEDSTETLLDDIESVMVETENDTGIVPGMIIQAPFLAGIKGKVNSVFAGPNHRVWIATDYGLLYFDGISWTMPGYRNYPFKEGDTFEALLGAKKHKDSASAESYAALLTDINDLDEEPLTVGQIVKIYRNPAAARITKICRSGEKLYFSTDAGLIEYDGYYWARCNIRGLDRAMMVDAIAIDDELWLASDGNIVTKANSLKQLTLMHVKWLPELTDDVYYEFISYVSSSRDWGTFGGNITFISYGEFMRTGEMGDTLGSFDSFDIAFTGSYGTAISPRLKVGLSAKLLYSKLSDLGTGLEKGRGTSTGFALDFGLLYQMSKRLTWGAALTNIGPRMAYIDAAQADDLPRNLSLGLAYKLLQTDYYHLLVTAEANKIIVGLDDGLRKEMEQLVLNTGAEFFYSGIIALRAGYVHDEEGDVKMMTLGVGLALFDTFKFDFSYIPSNSTESLRNTLRISVSVLP